MRQLAPGSFNSTFRLPSPTAGCLSQAEDTVRINQINWQIYSKHQRGLKLGWRSSFLRQCLLCLLSQILASLYQSPFDPQLWAQLHPILGDQFRLRGRRSIVLLVSKVHSWAMILPWSHTKVSNKQLLTLLHRGEDPASKLSLTIRAWGAILTSPQHSRPLAW